MQESCSIISLQGLHVAYTVRYYLLVWQTIDFSRMHGRSIRFEIWKEKKRRDGCMHQHGEAISVDRKQFPPWPLTSKSLLPVCHYKLLKWSTCHSNFKKFLIAFHRSFFYLCATPVSFLCNGRKLAWEKTNLPLIVECNIFLFFYLCTTAHSERLYVE